MSPLPKDLLQRFAGFSRINIIFVAIGIILGILLYRLFFHPLARFSGPLEARLLGTWRDRRLWRGTWHNDILQLHEKYGPVVRIGPNELSVADEKATKTLYGHGTKASKGEWYGTWDKTSAPNLFATRSKPDHSFLRRRVSPAYTMSAILRYEQFIQPCLDLMMDRLRNHADRNDVVDMSDWTRWLAFDVVGTLAYGSDFGQLENEGDPMKLGEAIHQIFYVVSNVGNWVGQSKFFQSPIMNRIATALGMPSPFATFTEWTERTIQERRINSGKNERHDMLQHFMEMKSADGGPATDQDVLGEAGNIIGAGADTTSGAMATCLYYICRHPDVYQQIQKEIDDYYEAHNLEGPISYTQTQDLTLLTAAVREAMRLLPSIVYQLPRVMPEDIIIADRKIPAGTNIGMSPIAANRNPEVWGPDANSFRPSRWLESEEMSRRLNANDMTFGGSGPRMCIGRNLALVEVHKFLAQLLRKFDVEFEDAERPWRIHAQWIAVRSDMRMRIRVRGGKMER